MAGKISEYANAVATFADGDLVDVSKRLSTSPDVFQSQKLEFAQFQAFIQANASNILNTNGLTLGGMYSHNLNSNYLTFTNGTLNISQGSLLVQAETNLGSTAVLFKKQNGDTMFNFLDNGNVIVGGNSTIDLGSNILTFDGDLILNSNVNAPNLPTASTGLSAGDFWNENGVVRVGTSGTGPSSIYTANGTLTGNRTVDLDSNKLTFDAGNSTDGGVVVDGSNYTGNQDSVFSVLGQVNSNFRINEKGFITNSEIEDNNILKLETSNNSFNLIHEAGRFSSKATDFKFIHPTFTTNYIEIDASRTRMKFFFLGNAVHDIMAEFDTNFYQSGFSSNKWISFGSSSRISTEDISLQGSTLIKGIGTSGSSALSIYDNDTTPVKLWDFLDNGNVNLGVDSAVNLDSNVLQFSNINSIGGLKFNGTSNNGIGLNLANGSNDFDFVVAGSSNTLIGTGSLGLLVGGAWAMQVKQNRQISIGSNFEPVAGYDLSVDKAYFDTEITVKSPAGIMQFNGYRTNNIDPSTATFPNDKDFGVHKNTSSGNVFLAFNDGGTIKTVQLT
jgi:hypothetical protein